MNDELGNMDELGGRMRIDRADQGFLTSFPSLRVRPAVAKASALTQPKWREQLCQTIARCYDGPDLGDSHSLLAEYINSALADLAEEVQLPRQGVPEFTPAGLALLTAASEELHTLGVTPEHLQAANRATSAAIKKLHPEREEQLIMASEWAFHLLQNPQ